eukprot:CAMPEP_0198261994 /NCGR_PEP_ID=MMETSP1447-20131203/10570_1 /TAXON_ID=420782 /ORGANISM="Chaetoceros dichaeta, Strain CCMP1751" /LENGTH=824 /DNA_ID=CAMNT_0043950055 /DNA_START=90 /DNA_END=2564 /DNA_ORIENTATION=-
MEGANYQAGTLLPPWTIKDYSHSYKESSNRLCFETGYFGLKLDVFDLSKILYRTFEPSEELSYFNALSKSNRARMDDSKLTEDELRIEITVPNEDGEQKTYRASNHTTAPRLWESGKIAQHYDFRGVEFRKESVGGSTGKNGGELLEGCNATLYVLVWPDSVTFTIELIPLEGGNTSSSSSSWWSNGFSLKLKMKDWILDQQFNPNSFRSNGEKITASLHCDIDKDRRKVLDKVMIEVSTTPVQELTSNFFSEYFNCFQLGRPNFQLLTRSFEINYTDIRDYDVFQIRVKNNNMGIDAYVPIMLFVQCLANPTGCCPILCDENYVPTAIPVQLSKNWHEASLRNYGRFYCLLPVKGNGEWTTFYMRIVYGYYGTLPSASHSNLSLVGYGEHGGRWEQLAIGCWGETYCMDIDMDCVENTITDIRMLMTKGEDNKKWNWSDAGGRGDWLHIQPVTDDDKVERRLLPFGWKTAYNSHGPCLSEVFYDGWYSADRCVGVSANVRTLRTDDYARTFTSLNFVFNQCMLATYTSFFCMGGIPMLKTPKVVLGNRDGLIEEYNVPDGLEIGSFFVKQRELTGEGPWFIGFPEQCIIDDRKWGKGWRALIIRKFEAIFDGVTYTNPSISLQATRKRYSIGTNLNLLLTKPVQTNSTQKRNQINHQGKQLKLDCFSAGDTLNLDLELITLPRNRVDYYGPNQAFGSHLEEKPNSWETVYREAEGNTLNVIIHHGGYVKHSYPVIIQAEGDTRVDFVIEGGVGVVPVRFDGLCSRKRSLFRCTDINTEEEVILQQEVHGNDFWQTEYDPLTCTYSIAFNVPLDGEQTSQWTLH